MKLLILDYSLRRLLYSNPYSIPSLTLLVHLFTLFASDDQVVLKVSYFAYIIYFFHKKLISSSTNTLIKNTAT